MGRSGVLANRYVGLMLRYVGSGLKTVDIWHLGLW